MKVFVILLSGLFLSSVAQDSKNMIEDLNFIQVCATLNNVNRTFANIWEIYNQFKTTGEVWIPVARGACLEDNVDCMSLNPVCAITNNSLQKTFPNKCVLEADQKNTGREWRIIYNGICPTNTGYGYVTSTSAPSTPKPEYTEKPVANYTKSTPRPLYSKPTLSKKYTTKNYLVSTTPSPSPSTSSYSGHYNKKPLVPAPSPLPSSLAEPVPQKNNYLPRPLVYPTPPPTNYIPQTHEDSKIYTTQLIQKYKDQASVASTNNYSPSIHTLIIDPVPSVNNYQKQKPHSSPALSQGPSQSSTLTQLYVALVNHFESLPEQETQTDKNYDNLPETSYYSTAAPIVTYTPKPSESYLDTNNNYKDILLPEISRLEQPFDAAEAEPLSNPPKEYYIPSKPSIAEQYVPDGGSVSISCANSKDAAQKSHPHVPSAYKIPCENSKNNEDTVQVFNSVGNYKTLSYTIPSTNENASSAEMPSPYVAVENPSHSYENPVKSYEAVPYSTPSDNSLPYNPSSTINHESQYYSSNEENPEVISYTAPKEKPSITYPSSDKYYAAPAEESLPSDEIPPPSYPRPAINYEASTYSSSEIPPSTYEEIKCPPNESPCSNITVYSSPVLDYKSLPSYTQNTNQVPSISDSEIYNEYEIADAIETESPSVEIAEFDNVAAVEEEEEQNSNSQVQTVYNGVVYQGPYHYEPKYKHINYGNFNFLPAQSPTKGKASQEVVALVPTYTYAALPASQFNALSINPFEQLLQLLATRNI